MARRFGVTGQLVLDDKPLSLQPMSETQPPSFSGTPQTPGIDVSPLTTAQAEAVRAFMDHAWAEAIGSDARLRNDDVIMDGWMRTVAHLREDSYCGSVANDTRWQFDAVQAGWLAEVADHALKGLSRYDALLSLTRGAEDIVRKRLENEDVSQVAYSSVPPNLRGDFLDEARRRAADWPEQSLFIELVGVARSMGKPVAAATSIEVAGQVLQAFDQLLNQPSYGILAPDVPPAVGPGTTEGC
ncbi:hypothetical protein [Hydrogenophaga soli]